MHGAGVLERALPLLTPPDPAGGLVLPIPWGKKWGQGLAAVGPPPTALHRPRTDPGLTPQQALLESHGCGTQAAWGHPGPGATVVTDSLLTLPAWGRREAEVPEASRASQLPGVERGGQKRWPAARGGGLAGASTPL